MQPALSTPLAAFILFAFTMSATPGPNNAMVAASGANFGIRRTIPHAAGIATGFALMILLVALGAGELLRSAPAIHALLRWVGALYLLWLAVKIARSDPHSVDPATQGRPMTMLQAALFQWINPKAWIVTMGAVATYTTVGGNVLAEAALLAAVFFIVSWPASAIWVSLGAGAARLLRSPSRIRAFNWLMAGLLILSLVPTLAE
jgi:threonine/homoserine/homoserine lactone efflux protein